MIYITGDTHYNYDNAKIFAFGADLSRDDYIIIAGDFGGIWYNKQSEKYKEQEKLLDSYSELNCNILFVDGNHENFDELYTYPTIEKFEGNVGQIRDNLFHLKRGEIYNINNKKIFTFGGANSVDKASRTEYISWWKEEIPSVKEMNYGLVNLEKNNWEVDYVITHTAPERIIKEFINTSNNPYEPSYFFSKLKDSTTVYLNEIYKNLKFKHWFFGHFHIDVLEIAPNFSVLYDDIISIKD